MDTLTLRWTIAGKAQVAAMDVVGTTPLDPDVLDCVNRDTNGWLFMSPAGGEARLNRALACYLPPGSLGSSLCLIGSVRWLLGKDFDRLPRLQIRAGL